MQQHRLAATGRGEDLGERRLLLGQQRGRRLAGAAPRALAGHRQHVVGQEACQAAGAQAAAPPQRGFVDRAVAARVVERRALTRAQPGRSPLPHRQQARGRSLAHDVQAVGGGQPATAAQTGGGAVGAAAPEVVFERFGAGLAGRQRGQTGGARLEHAFQVQGAGRRQDEGQGGAQRRKVVVAHLGGHVEQLLGDGGYLDQAQDVQMAAGVGRAPRRASTTPSTVCAPRRTATTEPRRTEAASSSGTR